ncbi:MAG: hypothetical protein NVS3B10_21830 [Polyangiales bacterium]
MTPAEAARLSAELAHELENLERVLGEILSGRTARDDTTTFALALLLMNFYTGAERSFHRVATALGGVPRGDRWHAQLLEDMALDIEGVRPPMLRRATAEGLGELLRFRHVVRSLYAWTLRRTELDALVDGLGALHAALTEDVTTFRAFLSALARG